MSKSNDLQWRPTASLAALRARAALFQKVRDFFKARGVLEVETPLLTSRTGTDLNLSPLEVPLGKQSFYLQTSPEFAMKRLLAAYPEQPFFQISKAFRAGEVGVRHNPEFTILEWYRPGWSLIALQTEVEALLQTTLKTPPACTKTYAQLFQERLDLCPHTCTQAQLAAVATQEELASPSELSKEQYLDLLMSHCIEPHLGFEQPLFVTEYPAAQAALARIKPANPLVAERFECYVRGIELANAYDELVDPKEQLQRFNADNAERRNKGLPTFQLDERLIQALSFLPSGSGIALGLDRLCLLALEASKLSEVMAFSWETVSY